MVASAPFDLGLKHGGPVLVQAVLENDRGILSKRMSFSGRGHVNNGKQIYARASDSRHGINSAGRPAAASVVT